jgi:hypothetical protein
LQLCGRATPEVGLAAIRQIHAREALLIEDVTHDGTNQHAANDGKWYRRGWGRKGHTSYEDNGLDPFSQHGDEWQKEHCVLFKEALDCAPSARDLDGGFHCGSQLYPPFLLHLADAEESHADDGDYDRGNQRESAFIVKFRRVPFVCADGIEDANERTTNDEAEKQAKSSA